MSKDEKNYFIDNLKEFISRIFEFRKAMKNNIQINEAYDYHDNMVKNKIIMRGLESEIEELYKSMSNIPSTSFWKSSSSECDIYKVHSKIPATIVKVLQSNTLQELNYIEIKDDDGEVIEDLQNIWEDIIGDDLDSLLEDILSVCLGEGDGALRLNVRNGKIKIDFVEGLNVEFDEDRIIFKDIFKEKDKEYILFSIYEPGKVSYELYNKNRYRLPLKSTEKTKDLRNITFVDSNGEIIPINLAIKTILFKSKLFEGRGGSVIDSKEMIIDAIDEIYSTLIQDGVRNSRSKTYIPYALLGKDDSGMYKKKNDFINNYISLDDSNVLSESYSPKIETIQPNIDISRYIDAYKYSVNLLIADWVSPASIEIGEHIVANTATEIKMRERVTIETIQNIERALDTILKNLIKSILQTYYLINFNEVLNIDYNVDIDWSEIGAPTMGELIDIYTKAAPGKQILTYELILKNIYPDKTKEEIENLAKQLEEINGINSEAQEDIKEDKNNESNVNDGLLNIDNNINTLTNDNKDDNI